jgi:phytoene dehydrogenase-like protein
MKTNEKSIIIIGAGFAGLAAGIYARLNGYHAQVFELHDQPGGLCTSWKRKGYIFDLCIHWLVGSAPGNALHDMWEETGGIQGREFINMDEYYRLENVDGRILTLYTNVDRLERSLLEFSPQDEKPVKNFIKGIKMCLGFYNPSKHDSFMTRTGQQVKTVLNFLWNSRQVKYWMKTSCGDFAGQFKDPMLKEAFNDLWVPEFSMIFMLFTFAYMHNKNAGYPAGGSMPLSEALESRFRELGGIITYKSRVDKILTENGKATGIRLADGTEHLASRVISAADGHATIFNMLDGKYGNENTFEPYNKWPLFPSLIFVSLGIKRPFNDIPITITGTTINLKNPVTIADEVRDKLTLHIFNHDQTMAPEGCTAMTIMLKSDYEYWKNLSVNRKDYLQKKDEISKTIIQALEQRFPGISAQVEVTDVATPLTFERYTGNWKGTFEGWLLTPVNSNVLMKPMQQTLPGLENFYMCGQWVEPGGGLPASIMSARRLLKKICREDKSKFRC